MKKANTIIAFVMLIACLPAKTTAGWCQVCGVDNAYNFQNALTQNSPACLFDPSNGWWFFGGGAVPDCSYEIPIDDDSVTFTHRFYNQPGAEECEIQFVDFYYDVVGDSASWAYAGRGTPSYTYGMAVSSFTISTVGIHPGSEIIFNASYFIRANSGTLCGDTWHYGFYVANQQCVVDVEFQPNSLPLTYHTEGSIGTEHVIELTRDDVDLFPQGLFIKFNLPPECLGDGTCDPTITLFPRSGTGPRFNLNPQHAAYFLIDNLTAPGYYDLEVLCGGVFDTVRANVHFIGYNGYQSSGTISNAVSGNTIRGARVSLWHHTNGGDTLYGGLIAGDGTYSFDVSAGTYSVLVQVPPGGEQWRGPFVVNSPIPYEDIQVSPTVDDTISPSVTLEYTSIGGIMEVDGAFKDLVAGIAVVEPVAGSITNVQASVNLFTEGDSTVEFTASQLNPSEAGSVTMRCIDRYGNRTDTTIILEECCQLRGDVNNDGAGLVDISDLVYLIDYMFTGGPLPTCHSAADIDASGDTLLDISDLIYLIDYMFTGGSEPPPCP